MWSASDKIRSWDERSLLAVQAVRIDFLNRPFAWLTLTGTSPAWLTVALTLNALHISGFHFIDRQGEFLRALYCPLFAWGVSTVLKRWMARKRPAERMSSLRPLTKTPSCGSFPSGHAATSFSFFVALLLLGHPLAPAVGVWALFVSISRAYLGVHYLTDIAGGISVGTICAFLVLRLIA